MTPGRVVLDASALLAWIHDEPGTATVDAALNAGAHLSAVNLAEVLSKLVERNQVTEPFLEALTDLGVTIEPYTQDDALATGVLRATTRAAGLSLGDRACLALGQRLGLPVLTADQAWAALAAPPTVQLIR